LDELKLFGYYYFTSSPKSKFHITTITRHRSVGKSTISQLFAKRIGLKYVSSDELGEEMCEKYERLDKDIKSGMIKELIRRFFRV